MALIIAVIIVPAVRATIANVLDNFICEPGFNGLLSDENLPLQKRLIYISRAADNFSELFAIIIRSCLKFFLLLF